MTGSTYDVAIVGYGPVGQALATLLGKRGWSVVVFDKQAGLYPLPRACHLDHEAMRILQAVGIAREIEAAIVPAREYLLLRADLSVLSDLPRGWATPTGWESSYHFYQPDIETIFDRVAKETPGVTVHQGVAVRDIQQHADGVVLLVDSDDAPVHARFVVGADGANSLVRQAVGIDRVDLGFEATWVVVDVEVREGHPLPRVPDTGQVLDPRQPGHMAWLGGRHYRWEFMIVDGGDAEVAAQPENIWPKLRTWVNPDSARLLRAAPYTFRSLIAESFHRGRVTIAGDAAHLMPPFMGQGMVSGLRDAATLTWILDLVLRGVAPVRFLEAYTASRRPHVTAYIEESVRVGQLVCETDPERAAARDRELAAQTATPPPFQPPAGSVLIPGPLSGRLAVQPTLAGDEALLLDDVTGNCFALLATDDMDLRLLADESVRTIDLLGIVPVVVRTEGEPAPEGDVQTVVEAGRRLRDWLDGAGATWVLVRPDGYVFHAGEGAAELDIALETLRSTIQTGAVTADRVVEEAR